MLSLAYQPKKRVFYFLELTLTFEVSTFDGKATKFNMKEMNNYLYIFHKM